MTLSRRELLSLIARGAALPQLLPLQPLVTAQLVPSGLTALAAAGTQAAQAAPATGAVLLLVIDGLRPDYVTPSLMPRLHTLGARGVRFDASHSVFPTVTRVNSSSIATGSYPETHGLLGNTVYSAKTFPTKGLNTSEYAELEAMEKAEGMLLTAPTLATTLQKAGRRMTVFSAGSTGSAKLLGSPDGAATVINPEYIRPASLRERLVHALGEPPEEAVPNNRRNQWVVDAYLKFGLGELRSDVTAIWFGDPDATAHATGIGSEKTTQALKFVDAEIGRIEDALRQQSLFAQTDIIVTSDHGFSTHTGTMKLATLVAPFARPLPDGTPDIVVTEGAINFRGAKDPARVAAVVAALQKRPEVGAIFTRPAAPDSMNGVVPGTLAFTVARWEHARSAEILVSGNWDEEKNDTGWTGRTTQGGVAGHGTSSPYDIHNTLLAAGPDFRERTVSRVPASNADLAPTILRILGVSAPSTMTGRSIDEALKSGPDPATVPVKERIETAKTADGAYQVEAHISVVGNARYLNFTRVARRAGEGR